MNYPRKLEQRGRGRQVRTEVCTAAFTAQGERLKEAGEYFRIGLVRVKVRYSCRRRPISRFLEAGRRFRGGEEQGRHEAGRIRLNSKDIRPTF